MTNFTVHGPYRISVEAHKGGRAIARDQTAFWQQCSEVASEKGCYVFGIAAGRGIMPFYVGSAKIKFQQECFTDRNQNIYQRALVSRKKGAPVIFLVVQPRKRGKPNLRHIQQLESFLIENAVAKNPELLNQQGIKQRGWRIVGVLGAGRGKPAQAAKKFSACMGL